MPNDARAAADSTPSRSPRLLYGGVLLFLLLILLTASSIRREWVQRQGQARAESIFRLVEGRTPVRPSETPGALAWLNLELLRYREQVADPAKARLYGEIAEHQEGRIPAPFEELGRALTLDLVPPADPADLPRFEPRVPAPPSLRAERLVASRGRWLALTRRRDLDRDGAADPANRLPALLAPHLVRVAEAMQASLSRHPLPPVPGSRPPVLVRLYALGDDGMLLSLPSPTEVPEGQARSSAIGEAREIGKLPRLPTFFTNEFFFRFDFQRREPRLAYSGVYLDIGGRGLVATLLAPLRVEGRPAVLAADFAFDIDWQGFARQIEPPMTASLSQPRAAAGPPSWSELAQGLAPRTPATVRKAMAQLAREPGAGREGTPYLRHGVVEGAGALAAFQVSDRTWLTVLFPRTRSHLPWLSLVLSGAMLVALLAGFEANRRRAESAQRKAERALDEKQNLLNTMQVPLLVVDPNTDAVVFRNQAAADLGVEVGGGIAGMIADDPKARAHYERMQVARPEPRRAYGLPLRVRGEEGEEERYAIVRSVAVTAPIEALEADERHRLGIFFVLDEELDLALWSEKLRGETRRDERRRLAGLLTHGVESLVRVLARVLRGGKGGPMPGELAAWLAGYVEARLRTTSWLLDHWDAVPPLPPDCTIEAAHARTTIERLQIVFAFAARDLELRTRLHWDNGVLCGRQDPDAPVLQVDIDWPEAYAFTSPVRGGFGFFLTEALVNAIRHGRPGSTPRLAIALDRVRRELSFLVENETGEADAAGAEDGESYGGRRILERLALLCGWRELCFERNATGFRTSWRVAVSERHDPARAD